MPETEQELIRRLKQGDPSAFHRLVDCYAKRLYGLAYSLLGNAEDAQDVVQETFSGAFKSIGNFEQRAALWTWLTRILVRQAARFKRRPVGAVKLVSLNAADDDDDPSLASRGAFVAGVEAKLDISAALSAMSSEYREVIVLRELQQMSYSEMSKALGVPIGTIESRLYRAREELRSKLKDWKKH